MAGGENQDFFQHTAYHAFEGYAPATNTWSIFPPMAIGWHGVAGGVVGNRSYAISGDVQSSGTGVMVSTPSAHAFDFSTQQ